MRDSQERESVGFSIGYGRGGQAKQQQAGKCAMIEGVPPLLGMRLVVATLRLRRLLGPCSGYLS